jgi:hypothetical protein
MQNFQHMECHSCGTTILVNTDLIGHIDEDELALCVSCKVDIKIYPKTKQTKCECGADAAGMLSHSTWCPKYVK